MSKTDVTKSTKKPRHGATLTKVLQQQQWFKQPDAVKRAAEVYKRWARGQRLIAIAAEMDLPYDGVCTDLRRAQSLARADTVLTIEEVRATLTDTHHDDMQRIRDQINSMPQDDIRRNSLEHLLRDHERDIADLYGLLHKDDGKPTVTQVLVQVGNAQPTPVSLLSDAELEAAALEAGVTDGEFEEVAE